MNVSFYTIFLAEALVSSGFAKTPSHDIKGMLIKTVCMLEKCHMIVCNDLKYIVHNVEGTTDRKRCYMFKALRNIQVIKPRKILKNSNVKGICKRFSGKL